MQPDDQDATFRPTGLDEYVGQDAAKEMLWTYMCAARAEDRPMEHALFTGDPGSGKTALARLVAEALETPHRIIARPLSPDELLQELYELQAGVLILDEIHMWTRNQKDTLLPLLDYGMLQTRYGSDEFEWLTVIALTTDPQKVPPALRSRLEIQPFFEAYTDDEMAEIVRSMASKAHLELSDDTCAALGRAAAGGPRQARALVKAARAIYHRDDRTVPNAERILAFRQVADDGLTRLHTEYLRVLHALGGQAGLTMMAARLRLDPREVEICETLLWDREYLRPGPRGRMLTMAGRQRLRRDNPTPERRSA